MPWKELSLMSLRKEFISLVLGEGSKFSQLCARFGISRKTGYKWLNRYRRDGMVGLADRSRRPQRSPGRTPASMEGEVIRIRSDHPAWGGRKIAARLVALGRENVPAPSTITAILARHGYIDPAESLNRPKMAGRSSNYRLA